MGNCIHGNYILVFDKITAQLSYLGKTGMKNNALMAVAVIRWVPQNVNSME